MVVADDDARAVAYNGRAEDLGCTQDGAIDGSLVAADVFHDLIFCVENDDAHLV